MIFKLGRRFGLAAINRRRGCCLLFFALALAGGLGSAVASGQTSVWTYHNDNARTGGNTNETILTPANVNASAFGKLFSCPVDGYVYAQPLYIPGVAIPGRGLHNVLYIATEHDSVYAFDADNGGPPLWQTSFINPAAGVATVLWTTANDATVIPEEGITSTPVIDTNSATLYAVATTVENGVVCYRLHALDIRTGLEITNTLVQASYGVISPESGSVDFTAYSQNQRCALALVNGSIYTGFASHEDLGTYYGWVLGWDARTLAQTGVYNDAPQGGQGGLWSSGNGPAADPAGNLYVLTGNADVVTNNASLNLNDYGDSFLKLSTSNGLNLVDYFTPFNQAYLNTDDQDLASGGGLVLPDEVGSAAHPHLLVGCGKEGRIYLVDRDNMGHYNANSDSQIVQEIPGAVKGVFGSPAYINGRLYYHAVGDVLTAFRFSGGELVPTPESQSPVTFGYPGATPVATADGTNNGIVWELKLDGYSTPAPAVLYAWNATNVSLELYDSAQAGGRDDGPLAVEFTSPVVANGKVYVAGAYGVAAYGLGSWASPPVITPAGGWFTNAVAVRLSSATAGAAIHYTLDGTAPTTSSPLYKGTIILTNLNGVILQSAAFQTGMVAGVASPAYFFNAASFQTAPVGAVFTGGPFNGNGVQGLAPSDTAGVYPQPHWNNLAGELGGPAPLMDQFGRLGPIVATWLANEAGGTASGTATPNDKLFDGYINHEGGGSTLVTLTGVPSGVYSLILYALGDSPGTSGHYLVNGDTNSAVYVSVGGPAFDGNFLQATGSSLMNAQTGNYIELDNIQPTNGVFVIQAVTDVSIAPLNGFQLIPANTPPSISIQFDPVAGAQLVLTGLSGQSSVIQASSDLVNWSSLATVTLSGSSAIFVDESSTQNPVQFYRAVPAQ